MDEFRVENFFSCFLYSPSRKEFFEVIASDEPIAVHIKLAEYLVELVGSAYIVLCEIFHEQINCDDLIVAS
jgi:hypothetical protein